MTYMVRRAVPDDLSAVLALYRHLSADDPELAIVEAKPAWGALLQSPMTMVVVADIDGFVAATCVLVIVPNLTRGARPFAIIENVVTDPGYRNRGLGTAVLHFAMRAAWEQRCYKVMLSSGRTEEATLRFYEKVGFKRGGKTFLRFDGSSDVRHSMSAMKLNHLRHTGGGRYPGQPSSGPRPSPG